MNVDGWVQLRKLVLEKQGVEEIEEIRLNTQEQSLECIGGDLFKPYFQVLKMPRMPGLTLECTSPNGLWIEFTGEHTGLQMFSEIVSSIRRQP